MFLTSEAFRLIDRQEVSRWDWRSTTVLLISYEWDPDRGGPEALAGRRLVLPLLEAGAHVHVITAVGADEPLGQNCETTVVPATPLSGNKLVRALQMVRSGIPEPECLWALSAIEAGARVLASLPSDTIVYGRAMPGSANIVAWHLAKLTGLPWVAHFSDDWPPVQALSNGKRWLAPYKEPLFNLWRHRIRRDAGALTFTNPSQAPALLGGTGRRYLPKAFVVTHLATDATCRNRPQQYDQFHIVHTGNLNPPGHTAEALLRGVRLFLDGTPAARGRVLFTQAGWNDGDVPEWRDRCGLGDVVRTIGRVTQAQVAELADSASLLVGMDYARPKSTTLLSKLPDYVAAGRPILVITASDSAMGRLFREDGVGLTASYDSPSDVAARIGLVFEAWLHRRSDALLPRAEAIESFTRRRAMEELAGAFAVARRARQTTGERSNHRLARLGDELAP